MNNDQQDRLARLAAARGGARPSADTVATTATSVSGFASPDPTTRIDPTMAIGATDPLGDLRRANQANKTSRTTAGKRKRNHVAGAGRVLAGGLSASTFLVGVAALASATTASSSSASKVPVTTAAPVIVERDIYVDENGNEIPAPIAATLLAGAPAAADAAAPATTVDPAAPTTTVDPAAVLAGTATADPAAAATPVPAQQASQSAARAPAAKQSNPAAPAPSPAPATAITTR